MKKLMIFAAIAAISTSTWAETPETQKKDSAEGFQFTTIDSVAITSVKNQKSAGTCWSYSGMSFLESEILRKTKKTYDFSEMFVVENTYMDRADKAVRTHGDV